jgi:hypothetical protein
MLIQRKELLQRLPVLAVAVVLALGLVPARPAQAQEQTFFACYVPEVGAIYLIRLEGLPGECLSVEHVEISWTEGGSATIPDNSITTAKLVDLAVTTAKLSNGAVTNTKLANDAVTSTNIVNGSLSAADLGTNSVGTSALINGSVTSAKLATAAVTSAHVVDNSLTSADLATNSVGTSELAPGAVTSADLANSLSISGSLWVGNQVSSDYFAGTTTITSFLVPNDLEIVLEPTDNPSIGSAFEIFHTSGLPIFAVSETGNAYVSGNLSVTGNLSKGSGSFLIDHPLDPENKYLSHSFVESPDMMNVYNGNVTLDENGRAWVELPSYFEALNRDYRYQLTPLGAAAPNLHVAQEIRDNRFQIAGGEPGVRVSWQVTGVRDDPYARMHRIQVETIKPPEERGSLLHPDAYEGRR